MRSGDREEFDAQFRLLCDGFAIPPGEKAEAYWRALQSMDLIMFSRVVDYAMGPDYPADQKGNRQFPTTNRCWEISRILRSRVVTHVAPREPEPTCDVWEREANIHLLGYITRRTREQLARYGVTGVGPTREEQDRIRPLLQPLLDAKRYWAIEMREGGTAERDKAYQQRLWRELMEVAERRITAMHEARAQQAAA